MIRKRLTIFWNTIRALWRTFSKPARVFMVVLALALLSIPILTGDYGYWLVTCGFLLVVGLISAYVIYRLLLK